jgi:hypothetical protein
MSFALHPVFISSLVVLILNDHILKDSIPGVVTGKLSDFAGMMMTPILIVATFELLTGRKVTVGQAWWVTAVLGTAFVAIQVVDIAADGYRVLMGSVHWLAGGLDGVPMEVAHVADPWDVIAVPAGLVCPILVRRRNQLSQVAVGSDRTTSTALSC